MEHNKSAKVCLACSVGGHLTQMLQLKALYCKYDYFFITEDTEITQELSKKEKIYFMKLINRRKLNFLFLFVYNTIKTICCLIKERPEFIISTGTLSAVPCCIIGKIFGIKLIYIESFAKINTPTLTGRIVYRFADLFIVQWEQMLKHYPKAKYGGGIY
jgi:beta-1,4-N-acetylglucosaminyltransferase